MRESLLKKFFLFSYGSWLGLVISLLGTMITTRILLPEDFGRASMFTLALNITMLFILFGTDQSFVRFFYEEEKEKRGGLLYNCLKIPLVVFVVVILGIITFNKEITLFLFEEENLTVSIMLILGTFSQALYTYGSYVVRMQQKANLYSILQITYRTLNVIILVVFYYYLGPSYEIIIYSTVATLLVLSVVSIAVEKKFWNIRNAFLPGLVHSKKEIFYFGYPLLPTMLITFLLQSFAQIAIKHWSSLEELGLYAAAIKLVALVTVLQAAFTTFWTPVCYEHFQNNPEDTLFYAKMTKIVSFFMFLVAITSIAGKDIIVFLLGQNYKEAANIMPFLVFMPVMYTISETTFIGIGFFKKTKWLIFIAGVSCVVNIFGNWLLVPKYGAIGASIATAFSYIVFFILRTHISLIYYKVDYGLKKIYFMIAVILAYAMCSIITSSFYFNLLLGMGVILLMSYLYKSYLLYGFRYIKSKYILEKAC